METAIFEKKKRCVLPEDFALIDFQSIKPYFDKLIGTEFTDIDQLDSWIKMHSEIDAFLNEELAWRYINYTRFTDNKEYADTYSFFIKEIQPSLVKIENEITKKMVNSIYFHQLPDFPLINFKRKANLRIELFREENIQLEVEQSNLSQEYASIVGSMQVLHKEKYLTMQQASTLLRETDRTLRQAIFEQIQDVRYEAKDRLTNIFNKLVVLRNEQAKNCGFANYRDYKHKALARFDYTIDDVFDFHKSVEKIAVPIQKRILEIKKNKLGLETLKPFDTQVNIYAQDPLKPFETSNELLEKSIKCFSRLDPEFGEILRTMKNKGFLDLDSRKGKAPGGYNYPLDENGVPFIFMNASGSIRDVTTMVHEGGHAVHSVLTRDLAYNELKHCPSEVAELASMSMELISMDNWDEFFSNPKDLLRAKIEQIEGVLDVLPWIATIDKFQHWIYTNQTHTAEERDDAWEKIFAQFSCGIINFDGYEKYRRNLWQKQLHIFEVPFYYIEYGIAQLGAIAIWKNYKENPILALENYKSALSLGYTKTIPELYETAGIKFDFSESYVKDLLDFVWEELESLVTQFQELS